VERTLIVLVEVEPMAGVIVPGQLSLVWPEVGDIVKDKMNALVMVTIGTEAAMMR